MNLPQASDAWERGDPYERYVGRWSRKVAPLFLRWLDVPAARRWLDIGCGTGALCGAILDVCAPSSVAGVERSAGFLETARRQLAGRAALHPGTATAIPLANACVDLAVSGLVLNFIEDQPAALAEMARVTGKGGMIAAYVWDYAGRMDLMRYFWDAAVELDADVARIDEGVRFPECRPDALSDLFATARFDQIEVTAIDIAAPFARFEDYWLPFLGGQGPAPSYAMSLAEASRTRLRERVRARIPVLPDGSIAMTVRAWAVRGRVTG